MKHQPENTLLRRRESDGRPLAFDLFLSIERPLESPITPLILIDHIVSFQTETGYRQAVKVEWCVISKFDPAGLIPFGIKNGAAVVKQTHVQTVDGEAWLDCLAQSWRTATVLCNEVKDLAEIIGEVNEKLKAVSNLGEFYVLAYDAKEGVVRLCDIDDSSCENEIGRLDIIANGDHNLYQVNQLCSSINRPIPIAKPDMFLTDAIIRLLTIPARLLIEDALEG